MNMMMTTVVNNITFMINKERLEAMTKMVNSQLEEKDRYTIDDLMNIYMKGDE